MNELERQVLNIIGEDSDNPDVFTDDSTGMAQIRDSINDAIEEVAMLTGGNKRTYTVSLRASKNFYRLAFQREQFAWVTDVWLSGLGRRLVQKDLIWLNNYNPRWLYNVGSPERYFPVGDDKIGIHPAPASDTDNLEVTCVVIPDRYTEDTDRVKLRDEYNRATVHYAVGDFFASRGDAARATKHFGKYAETMGLDYQESPERIWQNQTNKKDASWIGQNSANG